MRPSAPVLAVLLCAFLWGFWWHPVALVEGAGLHGPWIGLGMSAAALPAAAVWVLLRPGAASSRALVGAALVGAAVTFYAMAASYTDFIRAVLLFYLAPAWSTMIELFFLGRRWRVRSLAAIGLSLMGVLLITRGDIGVGGLGATGDWMALLSGMFWSAGTALIFTSRRAAPSVTVLVTALGGIAAALVIAALDGSLTGPLPDPAATVAGHPVAWLTVLAYVGAVLAGTIWGSFHLPPAVMTYLLSVEILVGVASAALLLDDPFGLFEVGGAVCILAAVLIEVMLTERTAKAAVLSGGRGGT